jgi:ssDNA-binding Zn-finger/Zn-ribbon topoisomerase 1
VRFFTVSGKPSRFLVELVKHGELTIEADGGELPTPCPKCETGVLVRRNGPYGEFQACSRLAHCDYKKNLDAGLVSRPSVKTRTSAGVGDLCPACRQGRMERKQGRFGVFVACSRWPKCNAKGS